MTGNRWSERLQERERSKPPSGRKSRRISSTTQTGRSYSSKTEHHCDFCDYSTFDPHRLIVHRRIHTGEKPFKCQRCPKIFAQIANLNAHNRMHDGIKPYKCHFCSFSATQQANIEAHERIHQGIKPYKCTYCPVTFAQLTNAQGHERSTHKDIVRDLPKKKRAPRMQRNKRRESKSE